MLRGALSNTASYIAKIIPEKVAYSHMQLYVSGMLMSRLPWEKTMDKICVMYIDIKKNIEIILNRVY